ncbi:MAG: nitroreductase family protein [Candidatus Sigynarchaeota archaeon]
MDFTRPIQDVIKARTSIRTFVPRALEPDLKAKLVSIMAESVASPFGASCELRWVTLEGIDPSQKRRLGTYGFIAGARDFIAGITKRGEAMGAEHLGYVLEKVILHATDLGIGTCWLAGTFNKEGFREAARVTADESLHAITPVGYPADRRLVEGVMRWIIKANARLPWERLFFDGRIGVPLTRENAGPLGDALDAVRLGPSAENHQPWRLVVVDGGEACHFYASGGMRLDRGIAACHFDLVVKARSVVGAWKIEDPGLSKPQGIDYVISWYKK